MTERHTILKGASKTLYESPDPGTAWLRFQGQGQTGWGTINAGLSALFMQRIEAIGLPTHFIRLQNSREHLVRLVDTLPLFISVHNMASAAFGERLGIAEGTPFTRSIVDFHLKDARLGNPLITQDHAMAFGWCGMAEWDEMTTTAIRLNDFLMGQFSAFHLELLSFRVEFGRSYRSLPEEDSLRICDEISLATCHLKDLRTGYMHRPLEGTESPEADAFYRDVAQRFGILAQVPTDGAVFHKKKARPSLRLLSS